MIFRKIVEICSGEVLSHTSIVNLMFLCIHASGKMYLMRGAILIISIPTVPMIVGEG